MDSLLPVVNQLQELYSTLDDVSSKDRVPTLLDLPQVAVVGSQSVGKSSILEAILGEACLPRGHGMVTKCPLILQLKHSSVSAVRAKVEQCPVLIGTEDTNIRSRFYAEFTHSPRKGFVSPSAIANEIESRTASILREHSSQCGDSASSDSSTRPSTSALSVSAKPIILKFMSPEVIDLTLIDLPGLIRVPTADQAADIDEQIKRIVLQYIRHVNCVILAVSAANVDLANSDSLRIAREVDPSGQRTIGVLTKSDLVEDASTLLSILEGRVYPLRRGYVLVKCRSQRESSPHPQLTIREHLEVEKTFFGAHPILASISQHCGISNLAKKLNAILIQHIRMFLPGIKNVIDQLLAEVQADLKRLGDPIELKSGAAGGILLHILTKYSKAVSDLLDGRASPSSLRCDSPTSTDEAACELIGGARLHYVFQDWFAPSIMKSDPLARLSDKEIQTAIRNASGSSSSLFVPEAAFEMLVKRQIRLLEQPAVQCVHQAVQEMLTITEFPVFQMAEFRRFPNLELKVREIAKGVILGRLSDALKAVTDFVKVELAFINKSHPDFVGGKRAIASFLLNSSRADENCERPNLIEPTPSRPNPLGSNQTPTTGNSDSDENRGLGTQQGFASFFWRRHPLQQTPAPPQLQPRPSATVRQQYLRVPASAGLQSQSPNNPSYTFLPLEFVSDNSERELMELELVKNLIASYFTIVKKTLSDIVPKTIMHFLVTSSREALHGELVTQLYREEMFSYLLEEATAIPEIRNRSLARIDTLQKAHHVLSQVNKELITTQFGPDQDNV